MTGSLERVHASVVLWSTPGRPFVLGLCGAQGSGKSTLSVALKQRLEGEGAKVALISLDDLYLAPQDRPVAIHPLFATRGVPGTHDVALGVQVFDDLIAGRETALPRFDKASDSPFAREVWPVVTAPDVIIFEGWCVGAQSQFDGELSAAVNALERDEDPDGVWRRHVKAQLDGPYRDLFRRIDRLVLLAAPGFEVVQSWRTQQEHDLSRMLENEGRSGRKVMADAEIARFIQHYERLTRYILREMPGRADLTLHLDADRGLL
ncbi:kinase [Asticcacaulis sp. AC402]|uniref:kinase n=1 Tax=Asticcacaulis sp. AC402 TaxID=1282361 RepID=UPI0003C40BCA|nr:kinase [Asticcacaulis sp. AC402]ESQ74725.1 kinase [Asticcacaulis sp. AC402]